MGTNPAKPEPLADALCDAIARRAERDRVRLYGFLVAWLLASWVFWGWVF